MGLPLPTKPTGGINLQHPLASGLVRAFPLREGSGTAEEIIGGLAGTLSDGAAWTTDADLGGICMDFDLGRILYTTDTLTHGNGDFSVFFGGRVFNDGNFHDAGALVGASIDSYSFGIHTNQEWKFTLRNVVDITSGITPVSGRVYTMGMAYDKGTSVLFHPYDHTTDAQVTPATIPDTNAPTQVNQQNCIGNGDNNTSSWGDNLAFVFVWGRLLTAAEFVQLHASPFAFFGKRFFLN